MNTFLPKTPAASSGSSLALLVAAWSNRPLRIETPALPAHPIFKGDRNYLRALRAAEMNAWAASGGDALRPAAAS